MDRQTAIEIHELHARICKALADPKRLMIITALRDGPLTVGELAETLDMSQSNTSQHLAVLRDRGIVEASKSGLNVTYRLASKKVVRAIDLLREFMVEQLSASQRISKAAAKSAARAI